jgi:hypothetical protein
VEYKSRSTILLLLWIWGILFQSFACAKRIVVIPSGRFPSSKSAVSSKEIISLDPLPPSTVFKKKPPLPPSSSVFLLGETPAGYGKHMTVDYEAVNTLISQTTRPSKPKKLTPAEQVLVSGFGIYEVACAVIAGLSVLGVIATNKKK